MPVIWFAGLKDFCWKMCKMIQVFDICLPNICGDVLSPEPLQSMAVAVMDTEHSDRASFQSHFPALPGGILWWALSVTSREQLPAGAGWSRATGSSHRAKLLQVWAVTPTAMWEPSFAPYSHFCLNSCWAPESFCLNTSGSASVLIWMWVQFWLWAGFHERCWRERPALGSCWRKEHLQILWLA